MVQQRSMRAVVQDGYGPFDRLTIHDMPIPTPDDGEVLIRVMASSVHADVWHSVTGLPYVLRLFGNGIRRPKQPIPGTDLAGIVEAVGSAVTTLSVGDRVFGEPRASMQWLNTGTLAEFAVAPVDSMYTFPDDLSFTEAASIPTSAVIALEVLRGEAQTTPGDAMLINGAGGAVGVFAIQIAKAMGANVTAVDRGRKLDVLRQLGADHVIDYEVEDFTKNGEVYDTLLDIATNRPYPQVKDSVNPQGNYVLVGHAGYSTKKRRWLGELGRYAAMLPRVPFDDRLELGRPTHDIPPMAAVTDMVRSGDIRPVVGALFTMDEVVDALHLVTIGDATGRVVVSIGTETEAH